MILIAITSFFSVPSRRHVPLGQVLTASVGGSVTIDPYDLPPIPDCPPSDPDCDPDTRLQLTVGLRVYPAFLGRGPGR
jgi:hypothetical protein